MTIHNPFTPSFGKVPVFMAGRTDLLHEMSAALEDPQGNPNLSSIIVGARGTGKTTLLYYLADVARAHGWIAVSATALPGMLQDIYERTLEASAHLTSGERPAPLKGIGIGQVLSLEWEPSAPSSGNWRTQMNALLNQLDEQNVGLLITVDEVIDGFDELVELAATYQHFVGEGRKVALFMAGLPGNVSALLKSKSVSFLRRSAKHALGTIPNIEVEEAFKLTVKEGGRNIDAQALVAAVDAIQGFPYLMQLVGYRMWERNPGTPIISKEDAAAGITLAMRDLSERVLEATYYDLSEGDLAFLGAMLEDATASRLTDLAKRLDRTSGYVSTYKRRLMEQGIIGARGQSHVAFELPGFREFLETHVD